MVLFLFAVVAAFVVFLGWRILLASKGVLRPLNCVRQAIDDLMVYGKDGAILIATIKSRTEFVQFRKYVANRKQEGCELSFPRAQWSAQYFTKVEALCNQEGINYTVRSGINDDMIFIDMDFSNDVEFAYKVFRKICIDVFGVDENAKVHLLFYGVES